MAGNIKGITIEIDGSTTKLQKALGDVSKKGRDLSTQLKDINKQLNFQPGNAELIAQKQRVLAESVKNTEERLKTLREAHKQASEQLARGEIGQDEFDALTREIIKAEDQLKYYNKELKKLDGAKIDKLSEDFKKAGESTKKVGENLTKNVTVPLAALGGASIAAFTEVDKGLDIVIKKTGATGDAADDLRDSFKNVYGSMPEDSETVGNAVGEINTQFGLTGDRLEETSVLMLKFAKINDADVTQSTLSAKKAMEMFNLEVEDLPMVLDAVAVEAQRTGVSSDKLFDSVTRGAPQLKAMGLSFEESVNLMATFEQKGIDSSKALSYMTRAQTQWAKEGKSMQQGLEELSEKLENATTHEERVAIAAEEFGTKGGAYMLEVLDQLGGELSEFGLANEDAAGTVNDTWAETQDPLDQLKTTFNNLKIAGAEMGAAIQETLAPMIQGLGEKVKELAEWFRNLDPDMQQVIIKVALVAAAIGPLLVVIGTLISSIGSIIGVLKPLILGIMGLSAPMLGVIAAVTAVIAIGVALYKNWDTVKQKAKELGENLSQKWDEIKNWTSEKWNAVKDGISGAIQKAKEDVANKASEIRNTISEKWNAIKTTTSNVWDGIKTAVSSAITGAWTAVTEKVDGIKSKVSGTFESLKGTVTRIWNSIKSAIQNPIAAARDFVSRAIERMKGFFKFTWSLPKIKLPHFSISGKFSLNPPQIPKFSISWYKDGGIFTKPTLFGTHSGIKGVGEAGPEAVLPIEKLPDLLGFDKFDIMITLLEVIARKNLSINGRILAEEMGQDISRYLALEGVR